MTELEVKKVEGTLKLTLMRWLNCLNKKIDNGSITFHFNNGVIVKKEIKEFFK